MIGNISDFLAQRRLAIVGISRQPNDFSRMLFRAFRERAFDVVPVNPTVAQIEDTPCYSRVQDIQPPVEAVLLMTAPAVTDEIVKDCAAAGIRRVWMCRHSPAAEAFCAANGMAVIAGECPMMFLENAGWLHRFHRWLSRK